MLPSTPRPDLDGLFRELEAALAEPAPEHPGHACSPETFCDEICRAYCAWEDRQFADKKEMAVVAYARSLEDNLERVKQAFYGWADQSDENRKVLAAEYLIGIGKIVVPPEVQAEAP